MSRVSRFGGLQLGNDSPAVIDQPQKIGQQMTGPSLAGRPSKAVDPEVQAELDLLLATLNFDPQGKK